MLPYGLLNRGTYQITIYIWQRTCNSCGQEHRDFSKSNVHQCDFMHHNYYQGYQGYNNHRCAGSLLYAGKAVGFKKDFIKLEDDCVDIVLRNMDNSYLPVCGILYTV